MPNLYNMQLKIHIWFLKKKNHIQYGFTHQQTSSQSSLSGIARVQ